MADHPRVEINLDKDFFRSALRQQVLGRKINAVVVYTGPLDQYFGHLLGRLGSRTLDFAFDHVPSNDFQGTTVVNEADRSVPHTRTIEFRHFRPDREVAPDQTVIAREFSRAAEAGDEPYYPINSADDRDRLRGYRGLAAAEPGVYFGGRLGTYKYLDMHMAIASALTLADRVASDRGWNQQSRHDS